MFIRAPLSHSFANSSAKFTLLVRSSGGMRVIEFGARTLTILWILTGILLSWYLFATVYLVMRDDLVVALLSGQRQAQYAYEDRVVELRTKIEQISARQVVNQDSIEDRVSNIVARQAELEARQVMVAELGTRAAANAGVNTRQQQDVVPASAIPAAPPVMPSFMDNAAANTLSFAPRNFITPAKPTPLDQTLSAPISANGKLGVPGFQRGSVPSIVKDIEKRASLVEQSQFQALEAIENASQNHVKLGRRAVAALGLDLSRFGKFGSGNTELKPIRMIEPLDAMVLRDVSNTNTAMGGPLLPARPVQDSERFEHYYSRSEQALTMASEARKVIQALPIGRPMGVNYDITSSFGTRVDPFTRGYALHAGIDFRAPTGTPVHSIGSGTVIEAGPSGGYGKMVEIDHGYGLTTRYAHLSAVHVEEGQRVEKGMTLGLVGSTGRSTGPHLHYEVRVDDDATDPMRYIRAARLIGEVAE